MRITCPKCQATYEVGETDIPEDGIEVECSACLNQWMQMPIIAAPLAPEPVEPAQADAATIDEAGAGEDQDAVVMDFPTADAQPAAPVLEAIAAASTLREDVFGKPISAPSEPELEAEAWPPAQSETAPSAGWRVPAPPKEQFLQQDPLDEILAEVGARPSGPSAAPEQEPEQEQEQEPSAPSQPEAGALVPDADEAESEADSASAESPIDTEAKAPEQDALPDEEPEIEASAPSAPEEDSAEVVAEATEDLDEEDSDEEQPEDAEPSGPSAPEQALVAEADAEISAPSAPDEPDEASLEEAAPEEELEPAESAPAEAEPAPAVAAPHWSEAIAAAPVVAKSSVAETAETNAEPSQPLDSDEAKKDMEDFIKTMSSSKPKDAEQATTESIVADAAPLEEPVEASDAEAEEEEVVFHPWDGAVAPEIGDAPAPEASAQENEAEDDFDWEEHPDPDGVLVHEVEEIEEGSVTEEHMETVERQNKGEFEPVVPEVTNVIQAVIPGVPTATIPSGHASRPAGNTPRKPAPVQSATEVEAAIRAQLTSLSMPKLGAVEEPETVKTGFFGRKKVLKKAPKKARQEKPKPANVSLAPAPKPSPAKAVSTNPLKDALRNDAEEEAPRRGKRTGFYLVLILFAAAVGLYLFAEQAAELVPAAAPYIEGFTDLVNQLRIMTTELIQKYMPGE